MTTKTIQAWLIHKQWSGDTSARIHLFTSEFGLIHSLCKGGRAPKRQALLQPFTPLWVGFGERHGIYYTNSVESISPALSLVGHGLFSALYLNELVYYTLKPMDSEPLLFQAYQETLNALVLSEERVHVESLLRRFEWALLCACGHGFSFSEEGRTGRKVSEQSYYQFIADEGFILAPSGISGAHLLALAADDLLDYEVLKSAKKIMRQAIDYLLGGRELKSRALYTQDHSKS
jgi:DNA repair protein RecO (recombination protein O)